MVSVLISYLCLCRLSHNSPFPEGSCHKPSTSSPWRTHTGPVCLTSSDTVWTWTEKQRVYDSKQFFFFFKPHCYRNSWWQSPKLGSAQLAYHSSAVPGELHHLVKLFSSTFMRRSSPAPSPSMRRRFRITSSESGNQTQQVRCYWANS